MRKKTKFLVVAALFAAFTFSAPPSALADTFGSGANTFTLDFVTIGNAGNAADTTTYGAVPYQYRMGKYEISQDAITKATASGMANVTAGAWTGNQPAASISWYEAAAFVNWLNTSSGYQAAYDLNWNGSAWSMTLWSSANAWTLGGTNRYRHSEAYYFLPSENEWYKAAYFNPQSSNYFLFPTASNTAPAVVRNGTNSGTAVYSGPTSDSGDPNTPAGVDVAGGLSAYSTMGQGGNVWEWLETEYTGTNENASEWRAFRGGFWQNAEDALRSTALGSRVYEAPTVDSSIIGFRVATVPEPSIYALLMTGAGVLWWSRRRR